MKTVEIRRLPSGEAIGARDLQRWANRRRVGRGGIGRNQKPTHKLDAADRWLARRGYAG
jgi:hypothetical protein